ncbi:hypothetical protein GC170_09130 [bacterium]|nr:hypothetical protein [bacterium]
MSTMTQPIPTVTTESPAERLRTTMAAARVSFTWLGVRKSLSAIQKDQAAVPFGAEGKFLSAGKKLLDTAHPAFRAVTGIRSRAVTYWKERSLPFPEPGIRLIRQDAVREFDLQMGEFRRELDTAVLELDRHYEDLRLAARVRLGELFDPSDYPETLVGLFGIEHDFPSVEPPPYLEQLSPDLYRQECRRVTARFDEAVRLAEQAFVEELARLVDHLAERLTGQEDGRPKVFRDTAVTNLSEFFERFRSLSVRSNDQLDELVRTAQRIVRNVEPQDLRDSRWLRSDVANRMAAVQAGLDQMMVDRPRRNIQRRARTDGATA